MLGSRSFSWSGGGKGFFLIATFVDVNAPRHVHGCEAAVAFYERCVVRLRNRRVGSVHQRVAKT
eukprot:2594176-Ditylum_brightwellii.AAC.1